MNLCRRLGLTRALVCLCCLAPITAVAQQAAPQPQPPQQKKQNPFEVVPQTTEQPKPERVEYRDDHIQGLDPKVVTFLGQSEMYLRSFTKIEPADREDLDDARARAKQQLMDTATQRTLAADFAPVRITLEEYESVLRDIKNLDSPKDLADIQMRIRRNGLIANLRAYQPRIMLLSQR